MCAPLFCAGVWVNKFICAIYSNVHTQTKWTQIWRARESKREKKQYRIEVAEEVTENRIDTAVRLRVVQSCALSVTVRKTSKKKEEKHIYKEKPLSITVLVQQCKTSVWKFAFSLSTNKIQFKKKKRSNKSNKECDQEIQPIYEQKKDQTKNI